VLLDASMISPPETGRFSVLLADDHALVRSGFRALLDAETDIDVVGEAADGPTTVQLVAALRPDVLLLDISMPGLSGLDVARQVLEGHPQQAILCLSMHRDLAYVREMLRIGAKGYLLKDCSAGQLLEGVRAVARGHAYLSPEVSAGVLADYREHVGSPLDRLSMREREVLQLVVEGRTNKEIARLLGISIYTVEAHRGHLQDKLNARSTGELVRLAMRLGLIS